MKIFLALTMVGLLSFSSAATTPDQAKADILAHVEPQIFNLLSIPGIARAGGGIKCYDKYLPLITAATENSKTDTEACISRSASRREDELNKVKSERENLDSQVKNVEATLTDCLNKTDDLEYLKCLKENAANLQNTISEVGKTSSSLSDNLSLSYKNIDNTEDACIKAVISKSKSVSDELLAALQNCLMNGLDGSSDGDSGSDGGLDGASDGTSGGSSDNSPSEGSDGDSNSGVDGGSDGSSGVISDDSSNGRTDGNSNGGSNSGSDGNLDNGSNGGSNSDSGIVPNPNALPEEDIKY